MSRHRLTSTFVVIAGLSTAAHAESPAISDLAPRETFLVAGVDDAKASLERLKNTAIWQLWRSDELSEMRKSVAEGFSEGPGAMLEELDIDKDALRWPAGSVGLALYVTMDEQGAPLPGFLVSADYGEEADHVSEVIESVKRSIDDRNDLSYEEQDVRGRTVISFDMRTEEPAGGVRDPFAPGPDEFDVGGPADAMEQALQTIHVVRDKNLFMVSSNLEKLRGALERCDGEGAGLGQRPDYQGLIGQLGEHDAFGALLLGDVGQLLGAVDPMGMMMMVMPMIQQVVGDIQGFGLGVRLDTPEAMMEQTITAYMPYGKSGLTALLEHATAYGEVPSFVGPNTISFSEVNFDFAGLPAALQPVVQMMMMMAPPPPPGEGPQLHELIAQVAACFGEKIYAVQTLDRPLTATSLKQFIAAECRKPRELEELIKMLGAGAGLQARDFVGHRLYVIDVDLGAMMPVDGVAGPTEPPAIGIGGGFMFTGPTSSVEQALRTIGQQDNATLAGEEPFQRALATLGSGRAVAWGYGNVIDSAEATFHLQQVQMEQMKVALEAEGVDMADWDDDAMLEAWMKELDADLFRKYIGPFAWKMVATDEGFVTRSYLLDGPGMEK